MSITYNGGSVVRNTSSLRRSIEFEHTLDLEEEYGIALNLFCVAAVA